MRNTTILLLLLFSINLFSQIEFAPQGAEWRIGSWADCGEKSDDYCSYVTCPYVYKLVKVTGGAVIDGKNCSALGLFIGTNPDDMQAERDTVLIWQNLQKIYFLHQDSFYLMMDFSLDQGDTLIYHAPPYFSEFAVNWSGWSTSGNENVFKRQSVVSSVDSIDIDGQLRKRIGFAFNELEGDTIGIGSWIEGIGNLGGFFGDNKVLTAEGHGLGFICYRDNDIMYSTRDCDNCDFPDFISSSNDAIESKDLVYPNPFTNELIIDDDVRHMELFNSQGNQIDVDLKSGVNSLNHLPSGIYFLRSRDQSFPTVKLLKL